MTRICPIASATLRVGLRGDPVTHSARLACPDVNHGSRERHAEWRARRLAFR
jgi:hypothetical protein